MTKSKIKNLFLLLLELCILTNICIAFYAFESASECYSQKYFMVPSHQQSKLPVCQIYTKEAPNNFKSKCVQPGILKVEGEYQQIRITCTASYAIDLFYEGVQPTEAINVTWYKKVEPNTFGMNVVYCMDVTIQSVQNLYDSHLSSRGSNLTTIHEYSRTGKYIFRAIWEPSLETSIYLFLEENKQSPKFLRNWKTTEAVIENGNLILPCLSSHLDTTIIVFKEDLNQRNSFTIIHSINDPTRGNVIRWSNNEAENGNYVCVLVGNNGNDEMRFKVPTKLKGVPFGFEELGGTVKGDVEINYKSRIDNESVIHIQPWCRGRVQNSNDPNTMLFSVPANNFGNLRLVREFALPKFANRSYTVRNGTVRVHLPRGEELWVAEANSLMDRFGVTFCQSNEEYKIIEYGTSHIDGEVVKTDFGLDWTTFDRETSPIYIFLILKLANRTESNVSPLYANVPITFKCRVHEAVVVKPILWYSIRTNGTVIEEYMDYNWIGGYSYFTKNMTTDVKQILCSGSFWYSKSWRNVSMSLNLIDGRAPRIITETSSFTLPPNVAHQIITCDIEGNPKPTAYWQRNGEDISVKAIRSETSIILSFKTISESDTGKYVCSAENLFGKVEKEFCVELEEETGGNYVIVVTIPALIIASIALSVWLYIRHWKKEQIGLTRQEIEEFMKGQIEKCDPQSEENGCQGHEFAQMVPYNSQHEISSTKFQIDESCILGAGAYGTVFKGLFNGLPVAIKTVNKSAEKQYLKALLSELKIMIYLGKHENIIEFIGSNTSQLAKGSVYIFVKYCPLGNLEHYLRNNRKNYNPKITADSEKNYINSFGYHSLLNWGKQIAEGMKFLGDKKVIHSDLAARNVLLDDALVAKITDFGLSRQLYDYDHYVKKNQEPLPWRWMAIESLRDMTFSPQSDIWSYGITLWEIFSLGETPYSGLSWDVGFIDELEKGMRMRKPKYATESCHETIISECWDENSMKRPSFQTLYDRLEQEWIVPFGPSPVDKQYTNENMTYVELGYATNQETP